MTFRTASTPAAGWRSLSRSIPRHGIVAFIVSLAACKATEAPGAPTPSVSGVSAEGQRAIADTITRLIEGAYDLTQPAAVQRLMSLYPDSGPVVSATDGRFTASRDSIQGAIESFWESMGRNMQRPKWVWGDRRVDVLSPTAAVMTATYTIPHAAPSGEAHTIGGAWTAVFQKRRGRWVIIHEHLSAGSQTMGPMTTGASPAGSPPE
jgi:ketosteroid isomerase-like protein